MKDLNTFNIKKVRYYKIIKDDKVIRIWGSIDNPIYGYQLKNLDGSFDNEYKMYRPFSDEYKWYGTGNVTQGLSNLSFKSDDIIITKSLKDIIVLSKLGYDALSPNSEHGFITDEEFTFLKEVYQNIYILYDSDLPGIIGSTKSCHKHDLPNLIIPFCKYKGKDISDVVKHFNLKGENGLEKAKECLNFMIDNVKDNHQRQLRRAS